MEISEPTVVVFYMSKYLALAPYSLRKNSKGKFEVRMTVLFAFYSFSLILTMICLTYRGLLFDANSKIPVRMKSATSKVVTALDVTVVVFSTTVGVISGLVGLKSTQMLNSRLYQVDETLHDFVDLRKERIRTYTLVFLSFLFISILLGLDIWIWIGLAKRMKIDEENTELNIQWYIPFYSLYYVLTALHVNIANTTFGVGKRYRRLNLTLKKAFLSDESGSQKFHNKMVTVKTINADFISSKMNMNKHSSDLQGTFSTNVSLIERLAESHASLGVCVQNISGSYGPAMLIIIVSCLLHLVATSYFLLLEFLNHGISVYTWLQVVWIIFHASRLLLIVEPCHLTTMEARQTITLLSQINRNTNDVILTESIRKFWQQLLADQVTFSACGLCRVDRGILTSISGAIATYLVILIQFQNSNG